MSACRAHVPHVGVALITKGFTYKELHDFR